MASNAGWNSQNGMSKPINAGKVDAYRLRQNQLGSSVLEQTDYSHFAPMQKKQVDMNNFGADRNRVTSPKKATKDPALSAAGGGWQSTG